MNEKKEIPQRDLIEETNSILLYHLNAMKLIHTGLRDLLETTDEEVKRLKGEIKQGV